MASTYTTSLKIQQIGNGEQSGTWGSTTNTNWTLAEQAITGVQSISMSNADYLLSNLNGTLDEARNAVIVVGGSLNATKQVIAPLVNKTYIVSNQTTGTPPNPSITFGGSSGSVITIPNGVTTVVYCDGTNFYSGVTGLVGNQTIAGNLTVTGNETVTGTLGVTGATTLSTLGVTTNATVGGTLTVTGTANLTSNLNVTGNITTNAGTVSAYNFSGNGTGLVGTASALTVGTANYATTAGSAGTANALNIANSYGMVNLAVTGAEYNADGAVSLPSYSFTNAHNSGMYRDTSSGDVRIASGGNECIAFTTSGVTEFPFTAASGTFPVSIGITGSFPVDRGLAIQNSGSSTIPIYFSVSSGAYNPGYISCTTTTTTYGTSSDYRLKENVAPMTGALATVQALNPVTYTWKSNGLSSQGFIAHELQAIVPDAVVGEKDAIDKDGNPQYQNIDTSFLVATLTAAIKELNAKVTALEAQLAK